ncbi:MAG TPA: hypothetical protein PLD95_04825 [bacterium]|jgi:hypothetical protein|nr:hypothetical protein [bacterium]HOG38758.1 hypothetical protein [bacterium]HQI03232.1 hypothetical protein [bacterium]
MADKFISATQTQVATKVSTKTQVLLGLMIAACLGGIFAIAGSMNKLIKKPNKPIEAEIKVDIGGKNGHCCARAGGGPCDVGTPCPFDGTEINDYGDIHDFIGECDCIPNAESPVDNVPNIKGGSSNLTTNYPITDEIKQKAKITKLDDGKVKYDYIIGENGEITAPKNIVDDGCACHLGGCSCPSICVSTETYDYQSDWYSESWTDSMSSNCRKNYSETSGFTHSEINGVVTQ